MTEKEEITEPKQAQQNEQVSSDTEFQEYNCESLDPQSDFDLQEQYLNKLKIQRKRIEELSQLHVQNQERIDRQIDKNRALNEQIIKLSAAKQYQSRYTQVMTSLDITTQENKSLKDQLNELKQEMFNSSSEKGNLIQKLRMEIAMQRDKENSKIQHLEDQLSSKQEQLDRVLRDQRTRERQLQDNISNLKSKISLIEQEHVNLIKIQQRKVERLERDMQARNSAGNEAQLNADALLKENVQLKEQNFRLTGQLNNKEMEVKSHYQKFKIKLNSLKKDLKSKEKQCLEFKETVRKFEREANDYTTETDTLKSELRKLRDSFQNQKSRWQADFSKEKQSLQMVIDRLNIKVHEIEADNKYLAEENKRLQTILRKKENIEKQRKYLLKSQMREIDKLEKTIDRIVD